MPVRVRGRLFGDLHLTTVAPGGFSSEDESLAASLAGTAAVAIENATLFEDSERRRRWQEAGAAAGRQLFDGDRDRALVAVLQLAKQAADGDFAMLVSTDDLGMPRVTAFLGAITAEEYAATPGLGAKVLDPVLQDGVPVLVEHDQPGPGAGPRFGSTVTVPFHDDDRVLAGLTVGRLSSHRPFQPADLDQFVAFTAQAEVVVRLDRARLEQETMNMLREHDRIAADLHDHVITELFATGMGMQGMLAFLGREDRDRLSGYVDSLDGTIRRIRETIFELHPPDSPPPDVKQRLVAVLEDARPTLGHPAHLEFAGPLAVEVPPGMADDLVAVVRESLANTARHARAGDVRVRVSLTGRKVTVEVVDDGCGIAGHPRGRGLANLTGRAERYGGSLKVEPCRGGGTRLVWTGRLPG